MVLSYLFKWILTSTDTDTPARTQIKRDRRTDQQKARFLMSDRMLEHMSDRMSQYMPINMSNWIPENTSCNVSIYISQDVR